MAKVKVDFSGIKKDLQKIKNQARIEVAAELEGQIRESIAKGLSPVKGQGRFEKYSQSYIKQIKAGRFNKESKKTRPVNLTLSGSLMKSLFTKPIRNGLLIGFDNKLAEIHNKLGAGKSKTIRRMLPTNQGEEFTRSITLRMREVVRKVVNRIIK